MTANLEQANALIKEYAELISNLQTEVAGLHKENQFLREELEELQFEMNSQSNREYDC